MLLLLVCDLSALLIAFCSSEIRLAGRASDLDNWSTYAFATTKNVAVESAAFFGLVPPCYFGITATLSFGIASSVALSIPR
jgi:hypothetical protein